MKVTKRQLRRIIKEEKEKLLNEQAGQDPVEILKAVYEALSDLTYNVDEEAATVLSKQLMQIEDAVEALGGFI